MKKEKTTKLDDAIKKIDVKILEEKELLKTKLASLNAKRKKLVDEKNSYILKLMDGLESDKIISMLETMKK